MQCTNVISPEGNITCQVVQGNIAESYPARDML